MLKKVKEAVPNTAVFANTGVRVANVEPHSWRPPDGAVVGTTFKRDGYIWNDVDMARVKEFMEKQKRRGQRSGTRMNTDEHG